MGDMNAYRIIVEDLKSKDHFRHPRVDERIILKLISKDLGLMMWTGFSWLRIETRGRLL
jgi:hypothetical protein